MKLPTGLFGGSFNPVHLGHVGLARWIADNAGVDGVWLSLSPSSPFKQNEAMLPDDLRLHLLRIATESYSVLHVTDVELSLPHPSYTVDALHELSSRNPGRGFRLIIGADNIAAFDRWRCWEEIAGRFGLIIYPRPGYDVSLPQFLEPFSENIRVLHGTPQFDVSSTEIRKRLVSGESLAGLVDSRVEEGLREYMAKFVLLK